MRAWPRIAIAIAVAAGVAIGIWLAVSGRGGGRDDVSAGDVLTGRAEAIEAKRRAMEAEQRAAEVARARADADEQARASRRLAAIATAFGARPGQPGPVFDGVHFDHDEPVPADALARIGDFETATDAQVRRFASYDGVQLFTAKGHGVIDAITRAWGPVPASGAWTDEPDRLVASLYHDGDIVEISWHAYQTVDDLIAPHDPDRFGFEPSSKPLIGATRDAVRALMHAGDFVSDGQLDMKLPPFDETDAGPIHVTFDLDGDTVTAFTIVTQSPRSADAVRAALAQKYGAPDGPWRRGRVTITLTNGSALGETIRVERAKR